MPVEEARRRQRRSSSLRTIAVTIEESLFELLEEASIESGMSRSYVVSRLLKRALESRARDE